MKEEQPPDQPIVLDEETRVAVEEGIRMADEDARRWTPAEVGTDAKRLSKEWRKNLKDQASA